MHVGVDVARHRFDALFQEIKFGEERSKTEVPIQRKVSDVATLVEKDGEKVEEKEEKSDEEVDEEATEGKIIFLEMLQTIVQLGLRCKMHSVH